jgi:hypothetical protein
VISAIPFVLPLLYQRAFGWTPVQAGLAVLFLFAGNLGIKPATTWMLRTFGFRRLLVSAHLVGVACLVAMGFFRADTPIVWMIIVLIVSGAARSTGFTAYNTITYADVDPSSMTGANVLDSTVQQIAIGSGIALGAVAISGGLALVGAHGGGTTLAYDFAFGVLALILLVSLIPAARLAPTAGGSLTARR